MNLDDKHDTKERQWDVNGRRAMFRDFGTSLSTITPQMREILSLTQTYDDSE